MKKSGLVVAAMLLTTLIMAACNEAGEQEEVGDTDGIVMIAEEFIQMLAEGQYEEATQHFDETMTAELTPTALEELWETLNEQAGAFIDQDYNATEQVDDEYHIVFIEGSFEAEDVLFSVTFDHDEQIAGFYIQ